MGRYTESDIVQNVAHVGVVTALIDKYEEGEYAQQSFDINGWNVKYWDEDIGLSGKKKCLYADLATKGELKVCILNTSEYSSVGEYWFAVFADDSLAVEEFLKDFNITDVAIEDMDSVCQTL